MTPTTRSRRDVNVNPYQARDAEARSKRVKLQSSSSPEPSTVSDDSALVPTVVPEDTTDASDVDSDMSSEVSESSDEPSDESEDDAEDSDMGDADDEARDEEGIVNLRANRGKKPVMKLADEEMEDIRPFLKDFLPKLKAANEELEAQKQAGTLETAEMIEEDGKDDAEEQYIELNLGLGVLEAEAEDASKATGSTNDNNDDNDDERPQDVLATLMGREKGAPAVQVVEEQERK